MSREDLITYYDYEVDQIEALSRALGNENFDWSESDSYVESGTALQDMLAKLHDTPDYTPTATDELIASYITADINAVKARHSIDDAALVAARPDAPTPEAAILTYVTAVKSGLEDHNRKIDAKLAAGTGTDPVSAQARPLNANDERRLTSNRGKNTKIIADVSAMEAVSKEQDSHITAAEFIEATERHQRGELSNEDYQALRHEFTIRTNRLKRVADAYLLVVGDKEHDFKNHDFLAVVNLDDDQQKTVSRQQRTLHAATQPLDPNQQAPVTQLPPLPPRSTPPHQPLPSAPPTPPSGNLPPTPPTGPTPSPASGTNGGNNLPPQGGLPTPSQGGNQQPSNGNTQPSNPDQQTGNLALEAAQARYQATMEDLAASCASRGGILLPARNGSASSEILHERLNDAIRDLMEQEKPEYLTDPSIDDRQRAALINAYYVAKRNDLTKQAAEKMGESGFSKFSKFIIKHRRAIGLGATVFGGILGGGIGGAIVGKAMASALTKMAKKGEANREAIAGSLVNGGESLDILDHYIANRQHAGEAVDVHEMARIAGMNLRDQQEKLTVKARRKGIVTACATGAAWGTLVWAGGHVLVDGMDYAWNGDGGVMDKLNHLSDPNGPTPWRPSAEKPWWMSHYSPWLLAVGGAAALTAAKARKDLLKKPHGSQRDYRLAS